MRGLAPFAVLAAFASLLLFSTTDAHGQSRASTTMFRAINCQVLDDQSRPLSVVAYRSMKNKDEVILISRTADHALLVDLKHSRAFKVPKPILGTNSVIVPNERPVKSGNVGFMVRENGRKKDATEIIVYFKDETCFLCGDQSFAVVWD